MLLTLSGFIIGILIGLTGVGGGSLMTPILIMAFKIPAAIAVGTDLLYASITKSFGVLGHHKQNHIDWSIVKQLMLGSIPASFLTSYFLSHNLVNNYQMASFIELFLGIALIITSFAVFFQPLIISKILKRPNISSFKRQKYTIVLGIILGFIVTLTSVGAGAIGVTMLLLIYPSLSIKKIIGTDIAHAVPLTLISGIGHAAIGTVSFSLLLYLILGSIPGVWLGAKLNAKANDEWVRILLVIILLGIGIKLIGNNLHV
jgi:uncharacterized membrane protein YfcA